VRKADNLPPTCAVVTKSGKLNFLEPSGHLRACNGTALPFTLIGYTRGNGLQAISSCVKAKSDGGKLNHDRNVGTVVTRLQIRHETDSYQKGLEYLVPR